MYISGIKPESVVYYVTIFIYLPICGDSLHSVGLLSRYICIRSEIRENILSASVFDNIHKRIHI
jgi:hypothetical protein